MKKYFNIFISTLILIITFMILKLSIAKEIIVIIVASLIIFYILKPCRDLMIKKGIGIRLASLLLVMIFSFVIIMLIVLILPSILNHSNGFINRINECVSMLNSLTKQFDGITKLEFVESFLEKVNVYLKNIIKDVSEKIIEIAVDISKKMVLALAVPIVTYYILSDFDRTIGKLSFLIPIKIRKETYKIFNDIDKVLRKYIAGQMILSLIMSVFVSLILYIFGIKYAIYFGVLNGVFNLIPYVGPIIASVPVVFVAFSKSMNTGIIILILLIVFQQIEGDLISPKIIGRFVEIHPVLIIFLLLIGGGIFGIIGLFLVVPVSIAIKVLFENLEYILSLRYLKKYKMK